MHIAIIGGGALGLMWSARMLALGYEVTLIVRTVEQCEYIREQGLTYTDGDTSKHYYPDVKQMDAYSGALPSLALLAVKQTHVQQLLPFLAKHKNDSGQLLTLQNGLGHVEVLRQVFSDAQIVLGSTSDGALRHSTHHVERTGRGHIWFGQAGVKAPSAPFALLYRHWNESGQEQAIVWDPDILQRLWRKCIINSAINPLTAIMRVSNGQLLQSPSIMALMQDIYNEGVAVARVLGYEFYDDLWQEIIHICRNTSRNDSSMLQDVRAMRRTEIDFINGYIVAQGERMHIPTPVNMSLVRMVHGLEEWMD